MLPQWSLRKHYASTVLSQEALCFHSGLSGSILLPPGGSFGGAGSKTTYEITEWSVAADQKNLVYYIQTYDNPGLRSLNFDKLPLDGGAIKVMPLNQPLDVTMLTPS